MGKDALGKFIKRSNINKRKEQGSKIKTQGNRAKIDKENKMGKEKNKKAAEPAKKAAVNFTKLCPKLFQAGKIVAAKQAAQHGPAFLFKKHEYLHVTCTFSYHGKARLNTVTIQV